MKTIHRFPVKFIGDTELKLPKSAVILSVTMHPCGAPMLYCMVEQGDPKKINATIRGIMTGEDFEKEELGVNLFLGTHNSYDGFVSHFFLTYDERAQ